MKLAGWGLSLSKRAWWDQGMAGWMRGVFHLRTRMQALFKPLNNHDGSLCLPLSALEALSPFYLLLNRFGMIRSCGGSLRQLHGPRLIGSHVDRVFVELDGADALDQFGADLDALQGRLLRLEARARPGVEFAGQLIRAEQPVRANGGGSAWILDLRPVLETLDDLEKLGLSLQELSLLDPVRVSMVTMLMDDALRQELLENLSEKNGIDDTI